jgi:para-nitrobenzyl esterase
MIGIPMEGDGSMDTVEVEGGLVKGTATDVGDVQVFKGIPFAGSTSGMNRWREPQPVEGWNETRICNTWGDREIQNVDWNSVDNFWGNEFYFDPNYAPKASENGLNLNIFTPAKTKNDKLPVLVFVHGGANSCGNASEMEFYASQLASRGIVVVNIQYRLGVFGFLALKELTDENPYGISGNYAILDIICALKWINKYIKGFGGDPERITVGGQSAGAMNVTALMRSPLAKGLFKRVIIQSGFFGLLTAGNTAVYQSLGERQDSCEAGIEKAFGRRMTLKELRAIPAEEYLTRKTVDGKSSLYAALSSELGGYAIDGYVFTKDSVDLMKKGALNGYDIMIGGTSDEMTSLYGGTDKVMPIPKFEGAMVETYGENYRDIYAPSDEHEAYRMFLRSMSDRYFQRFVLSTRYAKSHNKNVNVYTYYFCQTPPGRDSGFYGAYHSSDLWYVFHSLRDIPGQRKWTDADYRAADIVSTYVANFVKTGNPNGGGLTTWRQCTTGTNGAFIRLNEGYAYDVTTTPYPSRDALNRMIELKSLGITEKDIGNLR